VAALYYWVIGLGEFQQRFTSELDLGQYYQLKGHITDQGALGPVGYYDLLARGFARGKVYLPVMPPPELLALPNPWDERFNERYRLLDAVLFEGRYYLYHGAAPALLLFTPWYLLTRHDLPENFAAFLFALGSYILLSALFLRILRELKIRLASGLLLLFLIALGVSQAVPFLLHRPRVYEVAIAAGVFFLSGGFYCLFRVLRAEAGAAWWAGLSGLCFGLAAASRPHYGMAAAVALVLLVCRNQALPLFVRFVRREVLAFGALAGACAGAIMAYNYARFSDPLEFGLRYQLGYAFYRNIHLSLGNLLPGLYYLLACPPDLVPEFPFFRLALWHSFDRFLPPLPPRYFLEPTGGLLLLTPIVLLAPLPLLLRKVRQKPPVLALLAALCAYIVACVLFVAGTGLTSERYEVDFAPFLLLLGCVGAAVALPSLRGRARMIATAGVTILLVYGIATHLGLAVQGPYDQFVQTHPESYVKLARWFSPVARYRPQFNPSLQVEALFEFPQPCPARVEPLINLGDFGSRYLLSAECTAEGRIRLWSGTSFGSPFSTFVDVAPSKRALVGLTFLPDQVTMAISWNGNVVLRHRLRFLVTSLSQLQFGRDPSLGGQQVFDGRIVTWPVRFDGLTPSPQRQ